MIAKKIMVLIGVLAMVCVAAGTAYSSGYLVDDDLWIRAVINTVEKGPIDAMWERGGEDRTAGGDRVIWGHFYASPDDVIWGSRQNPDIFVKIWFDRGGRVDVNFFHVSVPDIDVYSSYRYQGAEDQQGRTTTERRYIRQYYENGESHTDESYEDGKPPAGYSPAGDLSGYALTTNLRIAALINTVEKGAVRALWLEGGTDTTADGHKVIWGHFYANPEDVSWGSKNNPDLFVKIWFDASGRVDVNFFHVSVPDIEVYSDLPIAGEYDSRGTTIIDNRYIRHEYHDKWWQSVSLSLLGDMGRPRDYAQTMKSFSESMPDYDAYVDQLLNAFDWRDKGMVTPAKHQGGCGSCWAFASVGALESKILIAGGPRYDLSEQQLLSCAGYDCGGGTAYALMFWYNESPMQENCAEYAETETDCINLEPCPRLSYNTEGYYTVKTETTNDIKTSLYEDGPAYFLFDVYSDFFTFWNSGSRGEVYTQTGGSFSGGHAVLIIGWDDNKKAWLCKNSWGENEGPDNDGTFRIAYSGHANDLYFGMANFKIRGHEEPEQRNPVANAGNDRTVDEGDTVTLNGSGSYDPDGSITSYSWKQTGGTTVGLSNAALAQPTFTAPDVGSQEESLSFRLIVTDNDGLQRTDTCTVLIKDAPEPDVQPVADAGSDLTVQEGDSVTLDGSGSTDTDGSIASYFWEQTAGSSVTFSNSASVWPRFTASDIGSLSFRLTVTDNDGLQDTDTCTVLVKDAPEPDAPPIADAGSDLIVQEGNSVTLDGSASYDPDGSITSYFWEQTAGSSVTFSNSTSVRPIFTAPDVGSQGGSLSFRLTITDNDGLQGTGTCTVLVKDMPVPNLPPVADAGSDQTAKEGYAVTLDGSDSSDPDGSIASYLWEQTAGPTVTLSNATAIQPTFTAPEVGSGGESLSFRMTVTDDDGLQDKDTCTLIVNDVPEQNLRPNADAGYEQTVEEKDTVFLDGSGSTDPDGSIASYIWEQTAGPAATLSNTTFIKPVFTAPDVSSDGTSLSFSLTVTDNKGLENTDTCIVIVNDVLEPNISPIANAGSDQTVNEGSIVTLDASGSTDPDGSIVSYFWEHIAGTTVSLSNATSVKPTFSAPDVGISLIFRLTVTDNSGLKNTDTVNIQIGQSDITMGIVNVPGSGGFCDIYDLDGNHLSKTSTIFGISLFPGTYILSINGTRQTVDVQPGQNDLIMGVVNVPGSGGFCDIYDLDGNHLSKTSTIFGISLFPGTYILSINGTRQTVDVQPGQNDLIMGVVNVPGSGGFCDIYDLDGNHLSKTSTIGGISLFPGTYIFSINGTRQTVNVHPGENIVNF